MTTNQFIFLAALAHTHCHAFFHYLLAEGICIVVLDCPLIIGHIISWVSPKTEGGLILKCYALESLMKLNSITHVFHTWAVSGRFGHVLIFVTSNEHYDCKMMIVISPRTLWQHGESGPLGRCMT